MRLRGSISALVILLCACGSSSGAPTNGGSGGAPAGAASRRTPCGPAAAKTLAADSSARIYAAGNVVYGCSHGHASYRLGAAARTLRESRVGPLALAGQIAAYGLTSFGVDTGTATVTVRRLRDGRVLSSDPADTLQIGAESFEEVASLVVKADGATAWIGVRSSIISRRQDIEVHRAKGSAQALLDSGTTIVAASLRLHASRLTWRHGGATRSATLS